MTCDLEILRPVTSDPRFFFFLLPMTAVKIVMERVEARSVPFPAADRLSSEMNSRRGGVYNAL